jgi:Protein of unknown function (DUF4007)
MTTRLPSTPGRPDEETANAQHLPQSGASRYRYSGHGTFPFRYTWLPKAIRSLNEHSNLFCDPDDAMVRLGVGKNMVRAIRFWVDATGAATSASNRPGEMNITTFGRCVLSENGHDEFLEDVQTLWLIHWNLATQMPQPVFAWDYLLNRWNRSEFTLREVLGMVQKEFDHQDRQLSPVTIEQHFTIFLHTYLPAGNSKRDSIEDSLDCPLVELEFIRMTGERPGAETDRRERIYSFRVEEKPEISAELFIYCLNDFWSKRFPMESTLSFSQVAVGECSPGQVFKLPEHFIRERLETLEHDSKGLFVYQESSALQQIQRKQQIAPEILLRRIYEHG